MYACVLIVQVDAAPGRPKIRVLSYVSTWCFLSGELQKQTIQQTLPEIDWDIKPLCKTLVIFLLVVVTI